MQPQMKGVGAQNTFNLKMKCSKPKNKQGGAGHKTTKKPMLKTQK